MTIVFKILAQKYPNKAFLIPNLGILFFREILQIHKLEGADSKYDNSFSKNLAQKCPNKTFLVPNLDIFLSSKNFTMTLI